MKRRNFLKGAGAAIAAVPVMVKGGFKEPVQPIAPEQEPEINWVAPDDLTGSRLWINGEEIPHVMDMQMREHDNQGVRQLELDVRVWQTRPLMEAVQSGEHLEIKAQFGDTGYKFVGVLYNREIVMIGSDILIETNLSFTSISRVGLSAL